MCRKRRVINRQVEDTVIDTFHRCASVTWAINSNQAHQIQRQRPWLLLMIWNASSILRYVINGNSGPKISSFITLDDKQRSTIRCVAITLAIAVHRVVMAGHSSSSRLLFLIQQLRWSRALARLIRDVKFGIDANQTAVVIVFYIPQ